MLLFRAAKKGRITRNSPTVQLVLSAVLISLIVYSWKFAGCPGFSDSYLCRPISPGFFLNELASINSTGNSSSYSDGDFARLVDIRNFTFLTGGRSCGNESDLILLILVHSDTVNFEKRWTIRNTWGSVSDGRFKLLFLLGLPGNRSMQNRLDEENESHGDLVQGDFVDSYRNLTYKHVMGLKWTRYFCPKAKYLLKTDDDVFVNLPKLLGYVDPETSSPRLPEESLLRCLPEFNARACRSSRSKWKVTFSEYRFRSYPPFCQGFTILYSADVVSKLYSLAQRSKYFWIDDVFVTGFLTTVAGIRPTSFGKLILPRENLRQVSDEGRDVDSYLLGPSNLSPTDIEKLWKKIKFGQS